ncbi:MAG: YicC family protein [Candidatus Aureabacteria bacterium]|nr:YicC family protein [Candidatus Auribacterota bacterium]
MFKSMTGYGFSEADTNIGKISIEIHSYNKKGLEIDANLPRAFYASESAIKKQIKKSVFRGKVEVNVGYRPVSKYTNILKINVPAAKKFVLQLKKGSKHLDIDCNINITDLFSFKGIVDIHTPGIPSRVIYSCARPVLNKALLSFAKMRRVEGLNLQKDIGGRIKILKSYLKMIKKHSKETVKIYRDKLIGNLKKLRYKTENERILREIAIFTEKSDISEEITRIESHFSQIGKMFFQISTVGRSIDFIIQEMFREINTIGSKANNYAVSCNVVKFKTELEKIREQIQNVE